MKRKNKKLITLMLAGLCAVSFGTALASSTVKADETSEVAASKYAITDVFATNDTNKDATLTAENETVAFKLGDGKYARIKRDLAFKWYEGKDDDATTDDAEYLTVKFAFAELNFKSVTFEVESSSSIASEDDKAVNAVKFTVEEGKVYATVINGDEEGSKNETSITAGADVTLALAKGNSFGAFGVTVNGVALQNEIENENGEKVKVNAEFTNVGANYSDYTLDKMHPLEITAEMEGDAKATILLKEINKQLFTGVKDSKITDTAAPVLVINEDVNGFQYGTAFSLSYEKIDVLQTSGLTESKKYYYYNPADEATNYDKTLSTSTYFMDTVYYKKDGEAPSKTAKDGYTATSVLAEEGREYVSVKITLGDDTFDDTKASDDTIPYAKKTYELAWYAADSAVYEKTLGDVTTNYIAVDENDSGATYKYIVANDGTAANDYVNEAEFEKQKQIYKNQLAEIAADTYAGSNSNFNLPALDWLIQDNGGYRGLKFTISYKTPSSSAAKSSSSLSYNNLKFAVADEGDYEFKVFANDKAGNTMKYYLDGKLVSVSTGNVWDIEEIPSFTFTIENLGIKVEEATSASSRKAEKILDETYTLSGLTVIGASNQQSDFSLYRLDVSKYNGPTITQSALTGVKYDEVRSEALANLDKVGTADDDEFATYFDLYLDIYASKVATAIDGNKGAVKSCFVKINEYNANITENDAEWEEYNKYNWNASSKSFKTVEEGEYLIVADYWEKELPMQRATAYKLVIVESEEDVAEGDSKIMAWVKNNVASVVLFGIAGVMLILIIILLLVKPSDETLEDVDAEVEGKKKKGA